MYSTWVPIDKAGGNLRLGGLPVTRSDREPEQNITEWGYVPSPPVEYTSVRVYVSLGVRDWGLSMVLEWLHQSADPTLNKDPDLTKTV